MADLRIQDQVVVRRPLLQGRGMTLIKIGTIVAFADNGKKAVVSFPADRTRSTIAIDELQPVREAYGRSRVQVDPVRRTISTYMR